MKIAGSSEGKAFKRLIAHRKKQLHYFAGFADSQHWLLCLP
jgi:hypothetical protein